MSDRDELEEMWVRIVDLERFRDDAEEMIGRLQAELRGVNEWVAEQRERVQGQCTPECGWSPVDEYHAAEIQAGDR